MKKVIVIFCLILISPALVMAEGLVEGLEIGSKAPNVMARKLDGKIFRLNKINAKLKVINFWWILCLPCKAEMPELAKLEELHPKVKFVAIHTVKVGKAEIISYLNTLTKAPKNVVMSNKKVLTLYKFQALPHTVVLDKDNIVRLVISGYRADTIEQIRKIIEKYGL